MAAKATYDRSIGEVLRAQLDAISQRVGVDPAAVPQMQPYLKQLSLPWEPKELLYEKDEEEDEAENDE